MISLAMICKASDEEAKKLDRALTSAGKHVDEICVTITGTNEAVDNVCAKHNAKVSHIEWHNDFAEARNYNFSQCSGDWILWLDADDLLKGGENLKKNVEMAEKAKVTGLAMLYHYSHDKNGDVEDSHWKVQLVKKGLYEWKGVIHEDLISEIGKNAKIHDITRVHTATKKDADASLKRNLAILEEAVKKEPNEPRHYFYLARCYLGVEDWVSVIPAIERYLELSHWKQERYDAMNMMGEAYMRLGDNTSAIKIHTAATLEMEDAPDAYIYKARNYLQQEKWTDALTCLEIAETRDKDAVVLKRAALYDHDLYLMSATCYINLGLNKNAFEAAKQAYTNRRTDKSMELMRIAAKLMKDEELTLTYRRLGEQMVEEPERLRALLASAPEEIKDDPRILQLAFSVEEPRVWPENSVAIMCGNSLESWDGESIRKGGIGGSETAVIEIARRMAAQGKEVVVYNRCDAHYEGKVIDGVTYKNFWQFNKKDTFNVLWIWRRTDILDEGVTAKKIIIDMHDVATDKYFTPDRLAQIDHVFVKSDYHKSLYPSVPEEKFVVVGNGIDTARFLTPVEKKPGMFIYTSTPNRGLENILDVWPEIRKAIPEAELHIFYGWNSFVAAQKHDPIQMEWVRVMEHKMNQDGIINHGRVDQNTLAEYQKQATLWLYPTEFPEIHCITALEMQAARCYPITTGYAALAETQKSGVKIPGDPKTPEWREKFVSEVVFAHENPDTLTAELAKGYEYAASCEWDNVTKVWVDTIS